MAAKVECPNCAHVMVIKTVKAGRFRPSCQKCRQTFVLEIKADASAGDEGFRFEVQRIAEGRELADLATRMDNEPTMPAAAPDSTRAVESRGTEVMADDRTMAMDDEQRAATAASASPSKLSSPQVSTHARSTLTGPAATRDAGSAMTADDRSAGSESNRAAIGRLGGYRLIKELGRGGMGSVYLATQLSLDRQVAIKTMQGRWTSSPRAVARFVREAYAAAQLVHHNIVQIYDLGEDKGTNFFSMELVRGGSLDDLLKKEGRLEPRRAATLVLQAARGLAFAHDNGMVHRDIKPANLMLNDEGLVKVADLGLVKTSAMTESDDADEGLNPMLASAHSNVTGAGSRMGTPAYMAPEQADDASSVDARADIYSLGCTFHALLTGKPPFTGKSVDEMISKHKTEPIVRPDRVVPGVAPELGAIVERMTAKRLEERYANLQEVIAALEKYLGSTPEEATRRQERSRRLIEATSRFAAVPTTPIRLGLPLAFAAVAVVLTLIGSLIGWRIGFGVALYGLLVPVVGLIAGTLVDRSSPVSSRVRLTLAGSRLGDRITWGLGALVIVALVVAAGLTLPAIVAVVAAIGTALAWRSIVAATIDRKRAGIVAEIEGILREIRLDGTDEDRVKQMVADAAGKDWEEAFEAVWDYDSMVAMRTVLANEGKGAGRRTARPIRDALVRRLEERAERVRQDRQKQVLVKVERASLKAQGKSDSEAEREAAAFAGAMVEMANEARLTIASLKGSLPAAEAFARRTRVKMMLAEARGGRPKRELDEPKADLGGMLAGWFGGRLRFAIGALLLVGCVFWMRQNGLLDAERLQQIGDAAQQQISQASESIREGNVNVDDVKAATAATSATIGGTTPLSLPVVGRFFDSLGPGVLGLLMVVTALLGGFRLTPFALIAVAVTLLLPQLGLPNFGLGGLWHWIAPTIGVLLIGVGTIVGRGK